MKASDLRNKTLSDLQQELMALLKEQFSLRMQRGSGQNPRSDLYNKVRKDIARIKTIMNEKRSAGEAV